MPLVLPLPIKALLETFPPGEGKFIREAGDFGASATAAEAASVIVTVRNVPARLLTGVCRDLRAMQDYVLALSNKVLQREVANTMRLVMAEPRSVLPSTSSQISIDVFIALKTCNDFKIGRVTKSINTVLGHIDVELWGEQDLRRTLFINVLHNPIALGNHWEFCDHADAIKAVCKESVIELDSNLSKKPEFPLLFVLLTHNTAARASMTLRALDLLRAEGFNVRCGTRTHVMIN